jgi:hypothetical protein
MPGVETVITLTLSERENGTQLHMRHTGFPDATQRDSHSQSWNPTLNKLTDLVDERGSAASVALLAAVPNVRRILAVMRARPGFQETEPLRA